MRKPNPIAKTLRRDMPEAERRLWSRLKNRQLGGLRFRRQHTIGPYVADFACLDAQLVVELDGGQHADDAQAAHDERRDAFIRRNGFAVIRFWNGEVSQRINDVLSAIHEAALDRIGELEDRRSRRPPSVGCADTSPAGGGGKWRRV